MVHALGTHPYRITVRGILLAATAALVLASAAVVFVLRYYAFYHFGVGPGTAVIVVGLPAGTVSIFVLLLATLVICQRARVSRRRAIGAALVVGLGLAIAACTYEVWRTTADRSGEGPGAGDLAPFFASLVGRR